MRALITGGAGFIGSHLCEELLGRGQQVLAFDNVSTGSLSNIAHLQGVPGFDYQQGTILDTDQLAAIISKVDIVYHLAAAVGVKYVLDNPVTALETNTAGTENVLKLAQRLGNKKVIITSSSEVYGKSDKLPFQENDDTVIGPTSVRRWGYACSKALDEFLALAYHREKALPVVVLRLFNTVGPRQTPGYGMVIPRLVTQALAGAPMTVYGDGDQKRCFTYVRDVVKAIVDIAQAPGAEGQVFNLGSNEEISINGLTEVVRQVLESSSEIIHVPFMEVYGEDFEETRRRVPDMSKIRRYISYEPNTDLRFIIREIARSLETSHQGTGKKVHGAPFPRVCPRKV